MSLWNLFSPSKRAREDDFIRQLFHLALADGDLDKVEMEYIHMIGNKLGLERERVNELREQYAEEDIRYLRPPSGESFFSLFYMINLILVDHEIHDKELQIAKQMVLKLGYTPDTVDIILNTIRQNQANNISVEETYEHLKDRLS
ncbi:TerB family tellurite resistance protein [Porifericola rhodea]|uniref:TerB family tellurite resistance protein n=1 Tax=Porifericola rhodea TaxID=930972 RepID=UPI00266652B5|nr:TerB family tellurite resistance protein [Porifericola rhodea]WKN32304.1 TerB family tellurite resistance protein [Porifericola rhodea]